MKRLSLFSKSIVLIALLCVGTGSLCAQTLYDAYLFDTWVDTNAWITLDSNAVSLIMPLPNRIRNTGRSSVTNIGFPFTLAGEESTKFSVNVYGTLRLGNTQVLASNSGVTPLNMVGQNMPKIEPFGGRMGMDSSSCMRYATFGDNGSRVLVVEMRLATYNTPRATLSAQVQLFETTGEVRLVYGPKTGDTLPMAMQNGIAASASDVVFIDMVANEALFSEGGVSQTNPTGMWPEEGRVYSFTINPDYCPRPGSVSIMNSNPDSLTLVWSGDGSQYRLYIPDAGIDTIVGDTTITLSGLYDTTTYNGTIQTVCPNDTSHSVTFSFITAINPTHTPLFSCDFEAVDAMSVWEQRWVRSGGGTWSRVSDNTRPTGKRQTARCQSGSLNPTNTWLITPNITLPTDANGYYLRWKQRLVNNYSIYPTIEVRIAASADTIANGAPTSAYSTVLYTKTGSTSGYESHQVSLAQYGGQTIRIAFIDNDNTGWCKLFIDDVDVVPTFRPDITFTAPDSVEVGDTLQLMATVIEGYTTGMTVEWHSTMEAHGEASLVSDSLQATIVYNTEGIDTITVTAIGQYGNRSATATIWVPDPLRYVVPHTILAADAMRVSVLDTVGFKVTLTGGSTDGLQHTWWSAMASRCEAMLYTTASDDSVYLVYLTSGQDTVAVHTVNVYGQSDDTVTLTVCPVQDTLPWVANFADDFLCWQVLEGTCEIHPSYGYLCFTDWPTTMVVSPLVYVPNDGNVVLEFDDAYSFFYGSLTVMVTTDMTTFDTLGVYPFVDGYHYPTRIPLNTYAGQHIHVVFKVTGDYLQFYLTNMSVHYALEPVVTLTVDDDYFPGTPMTLTANLVEGDTNGIFYRFTTTKTQRGEATLIQDSSAQAMLTCYTGGPDTVTVWVTNSYGTDSAWAVVNVKPCDTVDALTWVEDFNGHLDCWWQPEGSQWIVYDEYNYTMAVVVNVWQPTDNWLISRAITLPDLPIDGNDELLLCWDATSQINDTHSYCVMITTADDYRDLSVYDTLIAIDTVHPDITVGWDAMRASLSAYSGQTVRLAFRYTTEGWEPNGQFPGALEIDNIRIIDTTFPAPMPDTVWRTVLVVSDNESMGYVTGGGTYPDSSVVTISATPYEGNRFGSWNDGDTNAVRTLFLVSDTTFIAFFVPDTTPITHDTLWRTVMVTVNVDGVCETYGSGIYADSSMVAIGYMMIDTNTVGGHWQFLGWSDGATTNPRSIVVTSDTAIVALFEWVADSTEGINELSIYYSHFSIFPNPASMTVTVETDQPSTLSLTDATGRECGQWKVECGKTTLDISTLPAGVYFVRLSTSSTIRKLIIR